MALKDILTQGKYADDIVLSLPDGTTATVGEMRALEAEERSKLIQRAQVLEAAEVEFATRFQTAMSATQRQPEQRIDDAATRRAAQAEFGLDESDPLLGQVVKEMKRLESESKARLDAIEASHKTELAKVAGITSKLTGAYLDDYYKAKFDVAIAALPADIRKTVTLEDVTKFAESKRLMDEAGRYSIDEAVERLTFSKMKEHEMKAVRAQATIDAQKAESIARMKPSNGLRTQTEKSASDFTPTIKEGDRTRTKTLDEVLNDAAADDNLWASALSNSGLN